MTSDNRMSEIQANLKQDARELMQESANLLTKFLENSRNTLVIRSTSKPQVSPSRAKKDLLTL